MHISDNAGAIDEHRALNYLAVRYPAMNASVADAQARNALNKCGRSAPVAARRNAADRGGGVFLHQPDDQCHGEFLHSRRCGRRIPVPGDQVVAVLRPVTSKDREREPAIAEREGEKELRAYNHKE
jgi:hypothetical protein